MKSSGWLSAHPRGGVGVRGEHVREQTDRAQRTTSVSGVVVRASPIITTSIFRTRDTKRRRVSDHKDSDVEDMVVEDDEYYDDDDDDAKTLARWAQHEPEDIQSSCDSSEGGSTAFSMTAIEDVEEVVGGSQLSVSSGVVVVDDDVVDDSSSSRSSNDEEELSNHHYRASLTTSKMMMMRSRRMTEDVDDAPFNLQGIEQEQNQLNIFETPVISGGRKKTRVRALDVVKRVVDGSLENIESSSGSEDEDEPEHEVTPLMPSSKKKKKTADDRAMGISPATATPMSVTVSPSSRKSARRFRDSIEAPKHATQHTGSIYRRRLARLLNTGVPLHHRPAAGMQLYIDDALPSSSSCCWISSRCYVEERWVQLILSGGNTAVKAAGWYRLEHCEQFSECLCVSTHYATTVCKNCRLIPCNDQHGVMPPRPNLDHQRQQAARRCGVMPAFMASSVQVPIMCEREATRRPRWGAIEEMFRKMQLHASAVVVSQPSGTDVDIDGYGDGDGDSGGDGDVGLDVDEHHVGVDLSGEALSSSEPVEFPCLTPLMEAAAPSSGALVEEEAEEVGDEEDELRLDLDDLMMDDEDDEDDGCSATQLEDSSDN